MPEDVTRDLKAFTPVGLDRDALLFAAGRAAGRRWSGWKWLTAVLFVSNAVTIGAWFWPKPSVAPSQPLVESSPVVEPSEPYRPDPSSYIALRQEWEHPRLPEASGAPALPAPPLTPRAIHDLRMP